MTDTPTPGPRRRQRPQATTPDQASTMAAASTRHQTQSDAQDPDHRAPDAREASRGPDTAQLRQLYFLKLQGLTQVEIGRRLGRSERTVRNWLAQLNPAELGLQQAYSPRAVLNRELAQLETDAQQYRSWQRQAAGNGDIKLASEMLDRARKVDRERHQLLERLRVFDAARPLMPHARDSASAEAGEWLNLLSLDDDLPLEEASNDNAE